MIDILKSFRRVATAMSFQWHTPELLAEESSTNRESRDKVSRVRRRETDIAGFRLSALERLRLLVTPGKARRFRL